MRALRCSHARPQACLCLRALDQLSAHRWKACHCHNQGHRLGALRFGSARHGPDSANSELIRTFCEAAVAEDLLDCFVFHSYHLLRCLELAAASLRRPCASGGRGVDLGRLLIPPTLPVSAPAPGANRGADRRDKWRRLSMGSVPGTSQSADDVPGRPDCLARQGPSSGSSACSARSTAWPTSSGP